MASELVTTTALATTDVTTYNISIAQDKKQLADMDDAFLFGFYKFCKDATDARIAIFKELLKRGKKGEPTDPVTGETAIQRFFKKYGLSYDAEYMFYYREKKARELAANPPKPALPSAPEPLTTGGVVFRDTVLDKPLVVKHHNLTTNEVEVEDQSGNRKVVRDGVEIELDEYAVDIIPRANLVTEIEKLANDKKVADAAAKVCKKCATKDATIEKLQLLTSDQEAEIKAWKLATGAKSLKAFRKAQAVAVEKAAKAAKKAAKVAQPKDKTVGTPKFGTRGDTYVGFYWEYRKAAKPYAVLAVDTETYGTAPLCECNNQQDANAKVREYGNERANLPAEAAAATV